MTRLAEQELVARAKAGEEDAVSTLLLAHQDSLYAFMLRMSGRPEVAEDVVQEAFVRAIRNLDRFDPKYRFSTWLFTIAKRLYVNWAQKFRPIAETEIVRGWQSDRETPAAFASATEQRTRRQDLLDRALGELSEVQREIVLLFHQQEWPISRISEYLEMPEGTIKSHLHRARRKMRTVIEVLAESRAVHSRVESAV